MFEKEIYMHFVWQADGLAKVNPHIDVFILWPMCVVFNTDNVICLTYLWRFQNLALEGG